MKSIDYLKKSLRKALCIVIGRLVCDWLMWNGNVRLNGYAQ